MKKLWGGRFKKEMDPRFRDFSDSLFTDSQLLCAELSVNEAYVKMLRKSKYLSASEAAKLLRGIRQVGKNWKHGDECRYFAQYEDIHTCIQDLLEKRVGVVARKLHTGRSRNDLVVTSTRLFLRFKLQFITLKLIEVEKVLVKTAEKLSDVIIPGLTHLRKAQPVLLAHHLVAYVVMLDQDRERMGAACKRLNLLPLGSAALGGSSLKIDQRFLARQLGFEGIEANSLAAVSDRAFVAEILSALSILWMHLSRLAEDFILWNSEPYQFIELDDAFASGSSLMPQKKNPDVFELIRGGAATVFGELMSILTVQKGLPLSYNRDLQEDKPGVFRAIRKTVLALDALAPAVASTTWNRQAMELALQEDGLYATDLVEYLVRKKIPFGDAHRTVGEAVRYATQRETPLRELSIREWKKFSKAFGSDLYDLFDPKTSVSAKTTLGSTHPSRVRKEIRRWGTRLEQAAGRIKLPAH